MNFYEQWLETIRLNNDDKNYIMDFLSCSEKTTTPLINGNNKELIVACKLLIDKDIHDFIDCINNPVEFTSDDIIQYSNFEHAIISVNAILLFNNSELTYYDLGKELIHSNSKLACSKYGENHSKLAKEFNFVSFRKSKRVFIKNTALGKFNVALSYDDRIELIRRLGLRNKFIQTLIFYAKNSKISYYKLAKKVLSEKTIIRRKSNIKYLLELIIDDSELLNNIEW